ncbi:hypothetical protein BON30_40415 [Cystobacter ferrugineus]|uniref:Uncharacterized protein n=1 Tax=Cystobacter ferrugineus TaxID=83449 RepID=A0A1L9AXX4_9BACT|nr:hypothetical protein BON30_40415 [Cystobacter ferrugineus]
MALELSLDSGSHEWIQLVVGETGKLELVDTLYVGGIPRPMHHEVRVERVGTTVREFNTIYIGIRFVARLDGEVLPEIRGEASLDTGKGRCVLESPEFLSQGDLFPRRITPDELLAFRIVWELTILERKAPILLLVGLVDVGMGLCHALLENALEMVQLGSSQGAFKGEQALGCLNRPDGFLCHRTESSRRWGGEFPGT